MAHNSSQSVIIIGGGIVGLCIAVVAQARGHRVTLIARDRPEDTASGVAAGMIAPCGESDGAPGLVNLRRAQTAWLDLIAIWPAAVADAIRAQCLARSLSIVSGEREADEPAVLHARFGENYLGEATQDDLRRHGVSERYHGHIFSEEWVVDAAAVLTELRNDFVDRGGNVVDGSVDSVGAHTVRLSDGTTLAADATVIAAGYEAKAFADAVSALDLLTPIKGHILDFDSGMIPGMIRGGNGYLVAYGGRAKFGATMEEGRDDLTVEDEVVAELKERAKDMFPSLDLTDAVARVGIRASSPDGWPMIGRDPVSGVLVATAMRRNGFVFAPLAAQIITDLIEGRDTPGMEIYRPDRF